MKKILQQAIAFTGAAVFASCNPEFPQHCNCDSSNPTIRVFATGLNNPRGLTFGPDHNLYVAEAGIGGTDSTVGQCTQVSAPVGPYIGSTTGGRISRIDHSGTRHTVTDNLPTSKGNELAGGDIQGVSAVAFHNNTLYALLAGAGCSHGVATIPNGVVRIHNNGTWNMVADMSSWLVANPVANPPADFEPDGVAYSMVNAGGSLYVLEPNHGDFLRVHNGIINRVADISASQGHIVPTALAAHDGNFYVGNLNTFPIVDNSSNIYKISPAGDIEIYATGFTTVLGLAFDHMGRLYVLENTTGNPFPTPGTGRVVRLNADGSHTVVVSGLSVPTGMVFGPNEKLYISNNGFGPTAIGGGEILEVDICVCDDSQNKY
jgi:hypothetical protein